MYAEARRLRSLIKSCFEGPAWHGPAVMEILSQIEFDADLLGRRIGDSHNILELVHHMASWKAFIIKKLEGDAEFDVVGDFDWTPCEQPSQEDWQYALLRIQTNHQKMMEMLLHMEDAMLLEGVPGRSYNFFFLLAGIVNHDLYHLGQIRVLLMAVAGQETR